jgi:uncharacterized membrane protein
MSARDYLCEAAGIAGLLVLAGVVGSAWPDLPASVPSHFGPDGLPDAFGPRGTILILPAAGLGLYLLLTVISRFPHTFNFPWPVTPENAERQYRIARAALCALKGQTLWLFVYISWRTVSVARGEAGGLGIWFLPVFLALMAITTACFFWRSYRMR